MKNGTTRTSVKMYRKFGGISYKRTRKTRSKGIANKIANKARGDGHLARVVTQSGIHVIYVKK